MPELSLVFRIDLKERDTSFKNERHSYSKRKKDQVTKKLSIKTLDFSSVYRD